MRSEGPILQTGEGLRGVTDTETSMLPVARKRNVRSKI